MFKLKQKQSMDKLKILFHFPMFSQLGNIWKIFFLEIKLPVEILPPAFDLWHNLVLETEMSNIWKLYIFYKKIFYDILIF